MTTEAHHQIIDDFIQKSNVTDRRNEEREKATTISRCHKGQDLNLTDTSQHLVEQESGRIDFTMGKYVVWAVQLKMFTNNDLYFKFVWQSVFLFPSSMQV